MSEPNIDLFLKPGCPWCSGATAWLDAEGFRYIEHDVIADPVKFELMVELTKQSLAPCMRVRIEDGEDLILADFGTDELEAFVEKHGLSA